MLNGASVAFYREFTSGGGMPPLGSRDFQFIVGVNSNVVRSDEVPIVGYDPGQSEDDDWAPTGSIQDPITGAMKTYNRGTITPSTPEETAGMEPVAAWDLHHIVDRLMGFGHLWTKTAFEASQEARARRTLDGIE
jgi:hypothetical protein